MRLPRLRTETITYQMPLTGHFGVQARTF